MAAPRGNGTEVTIGVTQYIDDFLEQLIGHKPGESFDVEVTFPDEYPNNEDLAGKDAVFAVTVNYIVEQVTPELTDDFVQENLKDTYGWSTAQEAMDSIKSDLSWSASAEYLWEQVTSGSQIRRAAPEHGGLSVQPDAGGIPADGGQLRHDAG